MPISNQTIRHMEEAKRSLQGLLITRNTPADASHIRDHLVAIRTDMLILAKAIQQLAPAAEDTASVPPPQS
jgi:hypothetical protein